MSLLTQFYPGPGGGGSTTEGASYSGSASVVFGGVVTAPIASDASSLTGVAFTYYSTATSGNVITNFGGGNWSYVTVNNINLASLDLNTSSTRKIILNGGAIGNLQGSVAMPNFTGIYGSGVIGYIGITSNASNFTTISTDISFSVSAAGLSQSIQNAALDATSMNHVLVSMANSGAQYITSGAGRTINLSGGTSAGTSALTAAGSAAVAALVAAGWTVTLRP